MQHLSTMRDAFWSRGTPSQGVDAQRRERCRLGEGVGWLWLEVFVDGISTRQNNGSWLSTGTIWQGGNSRFVCCSSRLIAFPKNASFDQLTSSRRLPQYGMFESLELFLGSGSICTCVCVQIWGDMVVPKFMALQLWAMVKAWIVFISQPSHPIFSSFEALKSNVEFVFPYFYRVYVVSHKFMLMYAYVSYASKIVPTIYLKIWLDHARPFLGELPDSTGNGQGNGQPNSRKGKGKAKGKNTTEQWRTGRPGGCEVQGNHGKRLKKLNRQFFTHGKLPLNILNIVCVSK